MDAYADSSFLVSCYLTDANTPATHAFLSSLTQPLPFTLLHALEVPNAMRLGVFRGALTSTQAATALADLRSDLRAGRLQRVDVDWIAAFRHAARLSAGHTHRLGSRSLDILHVAAAKTPGQRSFLSFDHRQRNLATAAGLRVAPEQFNS